MYDGIVDAQTLGTHLDDPSWLVVDCRHLLTDFEAGSRAYAEGHIPGAYFARVEDDLSGHKTGKNGRHPLPSQHAFAAFLESLGARDDMQLVAYDAGGDMFAARFWFMCRWIGHSAVAVLDGGYTAWKGAGLPVTHDVSEPRPNGSIHVSDALDVTLDKDAILRNIDAHVFTLLDGRAPERFAGKTEPIDPVAGHIPGARNRNFKENFEGSGHFKPAAALRAEFAPFGDANSVVNYCGSGVSASANLLAMYVAGLRGMRIYPGSWSEWCADASLPVERD